MRSEEEIISRILHVAVSDDRIRAVLLMGSRADPNATRDILQDFDVAYIVTQMESFTKDKQWIDVFGERLILQMPEEMTIGIKDENAFHFLMLFKDGNRIDLTIFPLDKVKTDLKTEKFTTVLLDKDKLFDQLPLPSREYSIERPTQKEFLDCCNEFWWVGTYVGKGLCRKEVTYAKHMMEAPVRTMFLKMIEWYIGMKTNFTVSFGKAGRYMRQHIPPELYNEILSTYPDSNIDNIWTSLFGMAALFDKMAKEVAATMSFQYNKDEAHNVTGYLEWLQTFSNTK